jgi:hypothetical protein
MQREEEDACKEENLCKEGSLPNESLTAFGRAETSLRERCADASVDVDEFQRELSRCSLATCRGTCCYDGIAVDDDTAAALERLVAERATDLADIGLELPQTVIVENEWRGVTSRKTAVKPFPFRSLVPDFPPHFNETACVFLLRDGRCGLQAMAINDGKHPWYYKPFACWLHPIKLSASAIRLYDEATDPDVFPGYDGFVCRTHCGRTSPCGESAARLLSEELQFLGKLLDRDLVNEVRRDRT